MRRIVYIPARVVACTLLVPLFAAGCTNAPVQESADAQAAAYLGALLENKAERDEYTEAFMRRHKEFEPRLINATGQAKQQLLSSYFEQAFDPYIRDLRANKTELEALVPPKSLEQFHGSIKHGMSEKLAISSDVRAALQANDPAGLAEAIEKEAAADKDLAEKMLEGLQSAGFTSGEDVDRVLNTPESPLAWYWAILLMGISTVVGIWILSFVIGIISIGLTPLIILVTKLEESGKKLASRFGIAVLYLAIGFMFSLVGTAIAGIAEIFMFPRTQLSPWFVYIVMGWVAAGLAVGSNDETDPVARLGNCGLAIICLSTFIWAAVAKGALVGPWLWANQTVLNWISG